MHQHKKILLLPLLLLTGLQAYSQATNQNFIRIRQPRTAIISSTVLDRYTGNKDSVSVTFQYVDGLGRAIQTVQQQGSPLGYDVIQPMAYDQFGRDSVKYLPYTINSATPGAYQQNALADNTGSYLNSAQYLFYQQTGRGYANTLYPYAGTNFESSPLSRPMEQGAPGTAWQLSTSGVTGSGHTVKMDYSYNDQSAFVTTPVTNNAGSHKVALYTATINSDGSRTLARAGNNAVYATGQLDLTISKDENWNATSDGCLSTTETYKDKEGHVILQRNYNLKGSALEMLSTYYVYDDYGNLAFVLPPNVSPDGTTAISQTKLNNLCYQYRYDERGRLIQKKLPGKGWEYVVYNTIDQLVATQDSLQRANNQWIFTKYDGSGRPIMSGIWNNGGAAISRASLQTTLNSVTTLWETPTNSGNGYTTVAWPTTSITPLTINYYDLYTGIPGFPTNYVKPANESPQTRGLPTATLTAILNNPADMLWTVLYYDDLARNVKSYSEHYLGATANTNNYDAVTSTYNFTNAVTTVSRKHFTTASTTIPLLTITNTIIYDHAGRKLKSWEQIKNTNLTADTKKLISQVVYNEIGQVITKNLHSTDSVTFLQSIAYGYNERGWLLNSSAPLFEMQLQYNSVNNITGITPVAQYNGNIASQSWGTSTTLNSKSYTYVYDRLNRLTSGVSTDNYKEQNIAYDQAGNITALKRYKANTLIDNFTYTYSSTDQLLKLRDTLSSDLGVKQGTYQFTYDGNGNLTIDPSKPSGTINTAYNLLNLPQNVTGAKTITYTYDAKGNKLRRVSPFTGITDYIGGIEYDDNNTGIETVSFIQTEEGKAVPNSTTGYDYEYYLGDNLGNTRVTFDTNTGTAAVLQQDDYYPFGLEINRLTYSPKNEYLYNKKELQEELGEYDYGARFYDPVIARWNVVDAYAEHPDQISLSPYVYVGNNPIDRTDPDGNCFPCDFDTKTYDAIENLLFGVTSTEIVKDVKTVVDSKKSKAERIESGVDLAIIVVPLVFEIPEEGRGGFGEGPKIDISPEKPKIEPYNRESQYGKTPTKADRKVLGADKDHVVDHDPPLVKRYHEGDPNTGEKPGHKMTAQERKASANDRSRMKLQPKKDSQKQGAEMSKYSKQKNKENGNQ